MSKHGLETMNPFFFSCSVATRFSASIGKKLALAVIRLSWVHVDSDRWIVIDRWMDGMYCSSLPRGSWTGREKKKKKKKRIRNWGMGIGDDKNKRRSSVGSRKALS